jgi:catechol 2,3-dioxygenase-like lactoylglutathione lyase family enzyme
VRFLSDGAESRKQGESVIFRQLLSFASLPRGVALATLQTLNPRGAALEALLAGRVDRIERRKAARTGSGIAALMRPECDRQVTGLPTIEHMAIKKMEHVGIVVDDLAAAIEFFVELGLESGGTGQVEGEWVDRIIALEGTKAELVMLRTPDADVEIELVKFHSPPTQGGDPHAPSNTPGLRHLSFLVEDIDTVVAGLQARGTDLVGELVRYENSYRLCYVRGPEGIIIELAEKLG